MTQDSEHFTSESNYKPAYHVTIRTNVINISCHPKSNFSHKSDKLRGRSRTCAKLERDLLDTQGRICALQDKEAYLGSLARGESAFTTDCGKLQQIHWWNTVFSIDLFCYFFLNGDIFISIITFLWWLKVKNVYRGWKM